MNDEEKFKHRSCPVDEDLTKFPDCQDLNESGYTYSEIKINSK